MKYFLLSLIFVLPIWLQAQQATGQPGVPTTYAVVVGISKYATKGIPALKYANKDAQVFASFLQTNSGGSVPKENIRLLIDSNATTAAVYDAMSWLKQTAGKDDLVYFYFAGHGDMESETMYKLGFLLTYNTPRTNYINNAVRIEDLNNFANTISLEKKAKVVLITDACHSGQLAGKDFRGNFLVGEQLRAIKAKEIRITSCAKDELAMEDERWGGGRGVFSFYLINGLAGLADSHADGYVTLSEIRQYLSASFTTDPLLKEVSHKQSPVLQGSDEFPLAIVSTNNKDSMLPTVVATMSRVSKPTNSEPEDLVEEIFKSLETTFIEGAMQFEQLNMLPTPQITAVTVSMLKQLFYADSLTPYSKIKLENLQQLELLLVRNKALQKVFNRRLVILIHDRAQEVINLALAGDAAELERRRYYNASSSGYSVYPAMFALALKLTDPGDYLYRVLQVNYYYFSGLAAQIKIPMVANPQALVAEALKMTMKALELEKNAAYIYNQLGALHSYSKSYKTAEGNFLKATEISPQWAIPWSNLVGLYTATEDYRRASEAFETAKNLQPDLQNSYANAGALYEKQHNLLYAEELQRKSIQLNSRHFYPFERLGYIYINTTDYALADSFFYEADLRKQGYHFLESPTSMILPVTQFPVVEKVPCHLDTLRISPTDLLGNLAWAIQAFYNSNWETAELKFKRVIALDKSNPLAFHYLGKLLFQQKRWQEGDIILNYSVQYYLDSTELITYLQAHIKRMASASHNECLVRLVKEAYYPKSYNHYFLAKLYENWNHFTEAEVHYRILIDLEPTVISAYHQLWTMLEKIGRYHDAEKVIEMFMPVNSSLTNSELNSFYKRILHGLPGDGNWHFRAGQFLYRVAGAAPHRYVSDLKKILPDELEPSLVSKKLARPSGARFKIEALDSIIELSPYITTPLTDGIKYFLTADSLLANDETALADINDKIGDLYLWQGLPEKAFAHYQKSVDLQPGNSGVRLKLVDCYAATWQYQNAVVQLDSLLHKKEINFEKQLLLAKFYLHASRFKEAATLLASAKKIHPYTNAEIGDLTARMYLLKKDYGEALGSYNKLLENVGTNAATMYSLARLYAKTGKQKDAWLWLQRSVQNGFSYSFVLKSDPFLNELRGGVRWKEFMQDTNFKAYPPPATSFK